MEREEDVGGSERKINDRKKAEHLMNVNRDGLHYRHRISPFPD
jgi:hypothetical protein